MPLLDVLELAKSFPGVPHPVVDRVSFAAEAGQIFVLVGPSGCGKTTTLRLLAGFEQPQGGTIAMDGRLFDGPGVHVPPEQRGIGFVFQDYALFPHLNVLANVAFGLRGGTRGESEARALKSLERVGLAEIARRRPHDLSGGQQQRVALARALAPEPRLILLDEPFSNLDADLRRAMRRQLRALVRESRMGVVLVTHDQEEALSVADRLAVMRQGRIEQMGAPEAVYAAPASAFVAQFLGGTNLMQVEAQGARASSPLGVLTLEEPATGAVWISLRPEHLELVAAREGIPNAEVVAREFLGHDLSFRVRLNGAEYISQMDTDASYRVGDRVGLAPRGAAVVVREES